MEVYELNDCTGGFYDINEDNYVWMVTDYTIGDYCGNGYAVALRKDGMLEEGNLGHCSCYGPFDQWGTTITVEEFLAREKPDNIFDDDTTNLQAKVRELLNQ